ncbi:glyoxylate/hydroxypyruvate reductase A [Tistlia consotensis]|uniref:Glyoxylate/hydroxypyruvate reductase A n=1 Tax=Tistlia consotensis USBA 355 TaxID=560819 RepID=A0A1Y6BZD8_9PROT|nr:glyoxylate/hydroxypyruvate reductase A [Tistlia consotensis]SMF37271.1 glyoxylate/hydroxypyruvate reductase A [Tistlia consotensis USBA 355]SNR72630.1 glyoxylate/hydroxypyruvate reductase A [Tistlia consotensis]
MSEAELAMHGDGGPAKRPVLLFMSDYDDPAEWAPALAEAWPELEVRVWPEIGEPAEVDFALVWKPAPGSLRQFPNLRLIVNLGAGIDAIAADETLPADVPIARLADSGQSEMMTGFVVLSVLRHHRELRFFEAAQRERRWAYRHPREHRDCRVGVMGLGYLGLAAARALAGLGFEVAGWSRGRKAADGIECFAGQEELPAFLARTDILVAMLPATAETRGLLGREAFAALPEGAKFVNVGRGSTVDEQALIEALESGRLAEATLDVFETEPLPAEHPLWAMEQVLITPHLASVAVPRTAALQVVANCRRVLDGETPEYTVDRGRGY